MKEMISPYRHTPSARPTKISDLPSALESSLIAPRAALAALATAIPPPTQERPVESAAARYPNPVAFDAVLPAAYAACTGSPAKSMIPAIRTVLKKKNIFVPIALL